MICTLRHSHEQRSADIRTNVHLPRGKYCFQEAVDLAVILNALRALRG